MENITRRYGATASYATGLSVVTQAAKSRAPATGATYNWGTTAGPDRAVGFMGSGTYATPNAVMDQYQNTTGTTGYNLIWNSTASTLPPSASLFLRLPTDPPEHHK